MIRFPHVTLLPSLFFSPCFFHVSFFFSPSTIYIRTQSPRETDETINKLVDRSFLQEALPGSESYRVHGPVLSFAKAKLQRDGATTTRETVVRLQASYLGRVDVLLRFADGSGGASWRGCSELGGLVALSALWQSVERLRAGCSGGGGGGGKGSARLLGCMTYEPALKHMGLCAEAACGYWAAAKLLQLQVSGSLCPSSGEGCDCCESERGERHVVLLRWFAIRNVRTWDARARYEGVVIAV